MWKKLTIFGIKSYKQPKKFYHFHQYQPILHQYNMERNDGNRDFVIAALHTNPQSYLPGNQNDIYAAVPKRKQQDLKHDSHPFMQKSTILKD